MIIRSLFFRQLFSHVAIIFCMALTLSGSIMYFAHYGGTLAANVRNVAAFLAEELKTGYISDHELALAGQASGAVFWLEDSEGQLIQGNPPADLNAAYLKTSHTANYSHTFLFSTERPNAIMISVPVTIGHKPGLLLAYYQFNPGLFESVIRSFSFPFIVGLAAALLLAVLLSRKLTRSIADIAAAAKRFSAGDYTSRTRAITKDEIGTLGQTFNAMADALLHAQQSRRNFFSNISHELKTPLSCIKATTEALIDGIAVTDRDRTHYLERILSETDRMSRLVHDIMDMEQVESGRLLIKQEQLDVGALLLHQADTIEPLLRKKNLSLLLRLETDKRYIIGDADRFAQVLDNLLSNAIRYAPPGSPIGLLLTEDDKWLQIAVSDQGEGIDSEHLQLIWERFYRVDKSRTRALGGSGLGLPISRSLMEAMGGTILVESEKGQGTIFKIRIPWQK